ncbi:hypothetical protein G3I51_23890 [Streptomyces sp. SID9944]|nr:hypothetical protein [Streptomyces sp. SID9944]
MTRSIRDDAPADPDRPGDAPPAPTYVTRTGTLPLRLGRFDMGRIQWMTKHPEWHPARATEGEMAEYRHLLYDADEDATVPAFPYPTTPEEAS